MVHRSKVEYLEAIGARYLKAKRRGKTRILEEFCKVCGLTFRRRKNFEYFWMPADNLLPF